MNSKEYPVEPPEGIFHFPQDVFCLVKEEDTKKESIEITRISGSTFDFEVTDINLDEEEKINFPAKLLRKINKEESELEESELTEMISKIPDSGDRRKNVFDRRTGVSVVSENQKQRTEVQDRRFGEIDKTTINLNNENKFQVRITEGTIVKFGHTISYSAGSNLITLDDSTGAGDNWSNAYDMDDVLSACSSVVTKQGANAFDVSARMEFISGVYFKSTNEFIEINPNPSNPEWTFRINEDAHVQSGEYNPSDEYSYNGSFWRIYTSGNTASNRNGNRIEGEFLVYGSNIWLDGNSCSRGLQLIAGARVRYYNSIFKYGGYFWAPDMNMQDVKWFGGGTYDILFATGYNNNFSGVTSIDCNYGIFFSSTTNAPVDIYNQKFQDCTYDVGFISTSHLIRVINSPFETYYPLGSGRSFQECYEFNIKVTKDCLVTSEVVPIEDACVELRDVDGTLVFSEDTITNGVLTDNEIVVVNWFRHADQGGNKDYNPFTLKIIKDGYIDYEAPITIDHKIEEDLIVLLPYVHSSINTDQEVL